MISCCYVRIREIKSLFFSRPKTLGDLIKSGSLRKTQQRIDAANCNQPDEHGYAPLHYAVTYREAKIARYLLLPGKPR